MMVIVFFIAANNLWAKTAQPPGVFIPYWQIGKKIKATPSGQFIYFGITPGKTGIDTTDEGYKKILTPTADQKNALLVIRMTEQTMVNAVLNDTQKQQRIANQAVQIARGHNFRGLILDLEVSGLANEKTVNQITALVKQLFNRTKANKLSFSLLLFGDHFYRSRPYNLEALQKYVDRFYIMAYDLHKPFGTPGPNFPLRKGETFDYDLTSAIDQFTPTIPPDKLIVVFGMYGYDWIVDGKKRPLKKAKSLTLVQIKKKYLQSCSWKNCVIKRDEVSAETEVNYVDEAGRLHIVWFEDEQSVEKKIAFLKTRGVSNFAFWAWGYY